MSIINRIKSKMKMKTWIAEFSGDGWNDYFDITCPYCGKKYLKDDGAIEFGKYCPNCGKKVKRHEE